MTAKRQTQTMKAKRPEAQAMQAAKPTRKPMTRDEKLKPVRDALANNRGLNVDAMEDEQVLALWRRLPARVRQQYQAPPAQGDESGTGGRGTGESPTPDA